MKSLNKEDIELLNNDEEMLEANDPQVLVNNESTPETFEQKLHREMLQRMEKAYTDVSYEDPNIIKRYENFEEKVNVNSSTLVILCINKIY